MEDEYGLYNVYAVRLKDGGSEEVVRKWEIFAENCKTACDRVFPINIPEGTELRAEKQF